MPHREGLELLTRRISRVLIGPDGQRGLSLRALELLGIGWHCWIALRVVSVSDR
jgi:hypothetical protein